MKRRVVEQGGLTLMVSLPRKWAKKHNLKKGDEIDLEEQGIDLCISAKKEQSIKKLEINVSGLSVVLLYKYMFSAYNLGYDEIKIIFDESEILNLKTKKTEKIAERLQAITNDLIGFEIVEQKDKHWTLKDLGSIREDEFDNILRRIFLLTKMMVADFQDAINKNNNDTLLEMRLRQRNIEKFIRFCLRILSKEERPKSSTYNNILIELKELVDVYAWLGELESKKNKTDKRVIHLIEHVNSLLIHYIDTFHTYSKEDALEIAKKRRKCFEVVNKLRPELPKESQTFGNLTKIIDLVHLLLEMRIALEL
jgi:phosphate uptake regulator